MTAQESDSLNYNNIDYSLFSDPLGQYFEKQGYKYGLRAPHTANWRGYTADWIITDNTLKLVGFNGHLAEEDPELGQVIGLEMFGLTKGQCMDATWFTGELRVQDGKMLEYVHAGWASIYEREIILTIQGGQLIDETVIDNTELIEKGNQEHEKNADIDAEISRKITDVFEQQRPFWKRSWKGKYQAVMRPLVIPIALLFFILFSPLIIIYSICKHGFKVREWKLWW